MLDSVVGWVIQHGETAQLIDNSVWGTKASQVAEKDLIFDFRGQERGRGDNRQTVIMNGKQPVESRSSSYRGGDTKCSAFRDKLTLPCADAP